MNKNLTRLLGIALAVMTAVSFGLCIVLGVVLHRYHKIQAERQTVPEESLAGLAMQESLPEIPETDYTLYRAQCQEISYDEFARNADNLIQKYYTFTGQILQAMDGRYRLGVRVGNDFSYDDQIYLDYTPPAGEGRVLEDDIVQVWGTCMGLYTYTTTSGAEITVPRLYVGNLHVLTADEIAMLGSLDFRTVPVGTAQEDSGCTVKLDQVMMRPAYEDELESGESADDTCCVFFVLDFFNWSDVRYYVSGYAAEMYADGYPSELRYAYDELPGGISRLRSDALEPGYGIRGYVMTAVQADWENLELRIGETVFRISRSDFE